jgi:hypothetical protein
MGARASDRAKSRSLAWSMLAHAGNMGNTLPQAFEMFVTTPTLRNAIRGKPIWEVAGHCMASPTTHQDTPPRAGHKRRRERTAVDQGPECMYS